MNSCLESLKTAQEIKDQLPTLLSRLYYIKCKALKSENFDLFVENPEWNKLRQKLEKKFPVIPDISKIKGADVFEEAIPIILEELQPIYKIFVETYQYILKIKHSIKDFPSKITDFKMKKNRPLMTLWMENILAYIKVIYFLENFPEANSMLVLYNAAFMMGHDGEPLPFTNELKTFLKELYDFRKVSLLEYFQPLYGLLYATSVECVEIIQSVHNSETLRNNHYFNPVYDLSNLGEPTTPSVMMQRQQQQVLQQQISSISNTTGATTSTPHTSTVIGHLYSPKHLLQWYEEILDLSVYYEFVLVVALVSPWCFLQTSFVDLLQSVLEYRFVFPIYRDVTMNMHVEYEEMASIFTEYLASINTSDHAFSFFPSSASSTTTNSSTTTLPILPKTFKYTKLLKSLSRQSLSVTGIKQTARRRIFSSELEQLMKMCSVAPSIYASKWIMLCTLAKLLRDEIMAYFHHFPQIKQEIHISASSGTIPRHYERCYAPLAGRKDGKGYYQPMDYVHVSEITESIGCLANFISRCQSVYPTIIRPYYQQYILDYDLQLLMSSSLPATNNQTNPTLSKKQQHWFDELQEIFPSITPMLTKMHSMINTAAKAPPTTPSSIATSTNNQAENAYNSIETSSMQSLMILNSFHQHRLVTKQYPSVYDAYYTFITSWLLPHSRIAYGHVNVLHGDGDNNTEQNGINDSYQIVGLDWLVKEYWQLADIVWYEDILSHHCSLLLAYANIPPSNLHNEENTVGAILPKDLLHCSYWLYPLHTYHYVFEKATFSLESTFFSPMFMAVTSTISEELLVCYQRWISKYISNMSALQLQSHPLAIKDRLTETSGVGNGNVGMFRMAMDALPGSESMEENAKSITKLSQVQSCLVQFTISLVRFHSDITKEQGLRVFRRAFHFPQLLVNQWFLDYFNPKDSFYKFVFASSLYHHFLLEKEKRRGSFGSQGSQLSGSGSEVLNSKPQYHKRKTVQLSSLSQIQRFSVTYQQLLLTMHVCNDSLSYLNSSQDMKDKVPKFYHRMKYILSTVTAPNTSDSSVKLEELGIYGYLIENEVKQGSGKVKGEDKDEIEKESMRSDGNTGRRNSTSSAANSIGEEEDEEHEKVLLDYYVDWFLLLVDTIVNSSDNLNQFASTNNAMRRGNSMSSNTGPIVFVPFKGSFYNLSSLLPTNPASKPNTKTNLDRWNIEEYLQDEEIECLVRLIGIQGILYLEYHLLQYFVTQWRELVNLMEAEIVIWKDLESNYRYSLDQISQLQNLSAVHRILLTLSVILIIREILLKALGTVNHYILEDLYDSLTLYYTSLFSSPIIVKSMLSGKGGKEKGFSSELIRLAHSFGIDTGVFTKKLNATTVAKTYANVYDEGLALFLMQSFREPEKLVSALDVLRYLPVVGAALCTGSYYATAMTITLPTKGTNAHHSMGVNNNNLPSAFGFLNLLGNNGNGTKEGVVLVDQMVASSNVQLLPYGFSKLFTIIVNVTRSLNRPLTALPSVVHSITTIVDDSTLHLDYLTIVSKTLSLLHSYSVLFHSPPVAATSSLSSRMPSFLLSQPPEHTYQSTTSRVSSGSLLGGTNSTIATLTNNGSLPFPLMYTNLLYFIEYSAPLVHYGQVQQFIPYNFIHHMTVDMTFGKLKPSDTFTPFYAYNNGQLTEERDITEGEGEDMIPMDDSALGEVDKKYLISLL